MPKYFSNIISQSIKTSENLPLNILTTHKTTNTLPKKNCYLPLQISNLLLSCSHFLLLNRAGPHNDFVSTHQPHASSNPSMERGCGPSSYAQLRSYWQLRAALTARLRFSLRPYSKWIRLQGKATHSVYMGSTDRTRWIGG